MYFPLFLLALSLVVVIDLIALPIAWVTTIHSVSRSCRQSRGLFFLTLFCFPFYALALTLLDFCLAFRKLWETPQAVLTNHASTANPTSSY